MLLRLCRSWKRALRNHHCPEAAGARGTSQQSQTSRKYWREEVSLVLLRRLIRHLQNFVTVKVRRGQWLEWSNSLVRRRRLPAQLIWLVGVFAAAPAPSVVLLGTILPTVQVHRRRVLLPDWPDPLHFLTFDVILPMKSPLLPTFMIRCPTLKAPT